MPFPGHLGENLLAARPRIALERAKFCKHGILARDETYRHADIIMGAKGIIAAGHEKTAEAARIILQEGGNAFDAIVGANFAAMMAEPVLSSLGGGGFLLAHLGAGGNRLYDFFAHTPRRRPPPGTLDFRPILADFGAVTQEFHIGMGSIATPGMVKGMFEIHRDLGRMPMMEVIGPAVSMAREGIRVNAFQGYVFRIIGSIYTSSVESIAQFGNPEHPDRLVDEGDLLRLPRLADTLEVLAHEGEDLFYRGEIAAAIVGQCRENGGCLTDADLDNYRVLRRKPLTVSYRNVHLLLNPPPSCGGILIAFALELLKGRQLHELGFGSAEYLNTLADAMGLTNKARMEALVAGNTCEGAEAALFAPTLLATYRDEILGRGHSGKGTTHMSVVDGEGNIASMTVSNGEGCGYIVPDTGIMLNNMLGEEDLNPTGFHRWKPDQRLSSMMCPALMVQDDGNIVTTGSGGSNRIRTAILQVMLNLVDFRMPVSEAVISPRIHFEGGLLNVEGGFAPKEVEALVAEFPDHKVWEEKNLFFGGAHTVAYHPKSPTFEGIGDPRRAGVCTMAN